MLPPPSGKNPFKVTLPELEEALKNAGETEVVRSIARLLGVGGVYAEEVLLRANVEKTKPCKNLTDVEVKAIFERFKVCFQRFQHAIWSQA